MRLVNQKRITGAGKAIALAVIASMASLIAIIALCEPFGGSSGRKPVLDPCRNDAPKGAASKDARALPFAKVSTPEEVRRVVHFTRDAQRGDRSLLREMALRSQNALVAGHAIRALGRLKSVAGDPGLVALLHDPRLRVRQETVVALGLSDDSTMVGRLLPLLEAGDADLRPLVIQALGRLGDHRAVAPIRGLLRDPESTKTERVFARQAVEAIEATVNPSKIRLAPTRPWR